MTNGKTFYHVLHCKPQKDWNALNNARQCGWQAKLFWFKEPPKQPGRSPRVRNLMPGYVFVTGGSNYFSLQNPLYVNRLLCDGELNPLRINQDNPSMAALLETAKDNGLVESATAPLFNYDTGSIIEIFNGPFMGFDAKVTGMGKKQVEVELGMFGVPTKVKIPHTQVRRKAVVA